MLFVAALACIGDAVAEGLLGSGHADPPRVAALAAVPVSHQPPETPTTLAFQTYAPTPHLTPSPITPTTIPSPPPVTVVEAPATVAPDAPVRPEPQPRETAAPAALADTPSAVAARVRGTQLEVWASPTDGGAALTLPATTEFGEPRVLLATAFADGWVRVMLPVPPNGSEGWVRNADVVLFVVDDRIEVNLS